jgi:hypothetical protein
VAQALACGYYGIFTALMVGAGVLDYGVARGLWRRSRYAAAIVASAALSMVLILPFFLPYLSLERDGPFRTLDESRNWSATWPAYAASNAWAHRWMLAQLRERALVPADVLFPGFLVTGLALAAVGLALRSLGAAGRPAAVARSLGPAAAVQTAGAALMRGRRHPNWIAASVALVAALELAAIPLDLREQIPVPAANRMLARMPPGPVAEFPRRPVRHLPPQSVRLPQRRQAPRSAGAVQGPPPAADATGRRLGVRDCELAGVNLAQRTQSTQTRSVSSAGGVRRFGVRVPLWARRFAARRSGSPRPLRSLR